MSSSKINYQSKTSQSTNYIGETKMKTTYEKMSDLDLIALCKQYDENAQITLFERYVAYVWKSYKNHYELHKKVCVEYEDFKQDAFVSFLECIEAFDMEKAKENGVSSFFTVFYTKILKLMNRSEKELYRYGVMGYQSDYERGSSKGQGDVLMADEYINDWSKATSGNVEDDIEVDQKYQALSIYINQDKDELTNYVLECLLKGMNANSIMKSLDGGESYCKIRKVIDEVKLSIANIGYNVVGISN